MVRRVVSGGVKHGQQHPWRLTAVWVVFVLCAVAVVGRMFWLQVWQHNDFSHLADQQHQLAEDIQAERGTIFTQDSRVAVLDEEHLFPVATNQQFYLVYAQTYAIDDPEAVATELNSVLDLPEEVMSRITQQLAKQNDPYEPLVHRVTEEKITALAALDLPGIAWEKEYLRYYPSEQVGSNVLGFVGWVDDELLGQYGVEGYFQDDLAGQEGYRYTARDAAGRPIAIAVGNERPAADGVDIVLTIDDAIQSFACNALNEGVKRYDADGGAVVVLDPQTGAVLAMCSNPTFNPNAYGEVEDASWYVNKAIFDPYEPGSIFKPITMAAALDQGAVTPETTYEDTGEVVIEPHTIKNSDLQAHGIQTMVGVLKESLNTGMIFAMRQVGPNLFKEYIERFGFGEKTGIRLQTEQAGVIDSLQRRGEIYAATASFGQGITTTALQMVNAYAAIANGGILMRPYVIDRIISPDSTETITEPERLRRVIEPRTANVLSGMLVEVVRNGHAGKAGVDNYYIAGKTGTAQVAEGGEYGNQTIHSFVGFGPVADPAFVMIVRLDHPTAARFSSDTAAPVFGKIAEFILQYYQVPPDER